MVMAAFKVSLINNKKNNKNVYNPLQKEKKKKIRN